MTAGKMGTDSDSAVLHEAMPTTDRNQILLASAGNCLHAHKKVCSWALSLPRQAARGHFGQASSPREDDVDTRGVEQRLPDLTEAVCAAEVASIQQAADGRARDMLVSPVCTGVRKLSTSSHRTACSGSRRCGRPDRGKLQTNVTPSAPHGMRKSASDIVNIKIPGRNFTQLQLQATLKAKGTH